jgi:hypothetical protein
MNPNQTAANPRAKENTHMGPEQQQNGGTTHNTLILVQHATVVQFQSHESATMRSAKRLRSAGATRT